MRPKRSRRASLCWEMKIGRIDEVVRLDAVGIWEISNDTGAYNAFLAASIAPPYYG